MSDFIKHECGVAYVRLRKPLEYYIEKYGSPTYALNKMYILMEKQKNRGQDGAGIANIKINLPPGLRYISRYRSVEDQPIKDIFSKISRKYTKAQKDGGDHYYEAEWMRENCAFTGEVWLGHLRYGTHGKNNIENCHPMLRRNNWRSRNLVMAGNFNLTNVDELFELLIDLGQHPKEKVDTVSVMEKIGHFLDEEVENLFKKYNGQYDNREISEKIENELDLQRVLKRSCKDFDGGYLMCGMTGYGASFVVRDPNGIRPGYYYADDEVIVVASEKSAIKTAFDVEYEEIHEVEPGNALIINKAGDYAMFPVMEVKEKKSCSFERIYFSRGTDPEIYHERKMLGSLLVPKILKEINFDLKNTVFSYIPNTSESAFLGLMATVDDYLIARRKEVVIDGKPSADSLEEILSFRPRVEKLILKDAKLRTFIADDDHRDEMVAHAYDTTFEVINKNVDTIVVIDDSIVRGTTLEKSILKMLDTLCPKKIIVVSSAPQIRFPDCYGIDMSKITEFVAFRAMIALIKERKMDHLLEEVYDQCKAAGKEKNPINHVNKLYKQFTVEEISDKISEIVKSDGIKAEVKVIYQSVENLHKACPNHLGDWYFTGNFPTPGGNKVTNKAFVNFMEGKSERAY